MSEQRGRDTATRILDSRADAHERAMLEGACRAFDRRAAALRADTSGDDAARAARARTARFLEECANDVAALAGPIEPLQGRLALPSPIVLPSQRERGA